MLSVAKEDEDSVNMDDEIINEVFVVAFPALASVVGKDTVKGNKPNSKLLAIGTTEIIGIEVRLLSI